MSPARVPPPIPLDAGKVLGCVPPPFLSLNPPFFFWGADQRMVLVACGPYTTSDSLAYDPLADLIDVIARDRPDVCVLVRWGGAHGGGWAPPLPPVGVGGGENPAFIT